MSNPLVSVVIPSYNHAIYLSKAIKSVKNQSYTNVEVIVMDDGSTDHTKQVVADFENVVYLYQQNAGLSAARNNAIPHCKGEFVLFLDADDWLYPEALNHHLRYLLKDPELYFVSGSHMKIFVDRNILIQKADYDITEDHFLYILQHHYISHPASVLFRRKALDTYIFDINYKSCQDFAIYLAISKNHKVLHHSHLVSAYRLHSSNMSSNYVLMLNELLDILDKYKLDLHSENELKAYTEGRKMFIKFYTKSLYWDKLRRFKIKGTNEEVGILRKHNPSLYIRYLVNYILKR
ncbi:glycosyltransferase family 2 protein [Anditalea andensis]|uniref:Glycosyltransferase 2-like domain-containing protein n=1 Tax=Anditalea andensis TaxID=1048983 RepID=A0A074KYG3_9BACT|nr:glycosyltransferase [Anditalea andensis]KEO72603.1 hypothetical protein EL17_17855 [Anditalea andensis]